jgi:hypothetical protein
MSNEMMIQDSRPSAMPYLIGGATVGSLGGMYASNKIPYFAGKKMKLSEIIEEVNSKDKFEARAKTLTKKEAKLWHALKEKMTNLTEIKNGIHNDLYKNNLLYNGFVNAPKKTFSDKKYFAKDFINNNDYTTAKSKYKNALKDAQKNIKVGGKMKWLLPVVGAFTLGLAALGLRPKAKEV